MATTSRTLHRRLAEHGTSFRQLLDSVRLDLARAYLGETELPVTEIGFLIGFADLSSFSRAFKRWTGPSPAEFRAAKLAA